MLAAEIKKKLGRALACSVCHERSDSSSYFGFEDVLTSNVFGALRYLEPQLGLGPVLRGLGLDPIGPASVEFWLEIEGCEPDVIIDLGHSVVIVETKLNAPFGEDQLPREVLYAHRCAKGRPWRLLCVTDHAREPKHHMFSHDRTLLAGSHATLGSGVASYFEHKNETDLLPAEIDERIYWMPWSEIAQRLDDVRRDVVSPPNARALLDDLLTSLEARGLTRPPFHGFGRLPVTELTWSLPAIWATPPAPRTLTWILPDFTGEWSATKWFARDARFAGFNASADVALSAYTGWFSSTKGGGDG